MTNKDKDSQGWFILGSKTQEPPKSSNPFGQGQNFGPKEFELKVRVQGVIK